VAAVAAWTTGLAVSVVGGEKDTPMSSRATKSVVKGTKPSSVGRAQEPILTLPSAGAWWDWLKIHHPDLTSVWLRIPKGSPSHTLTYAAAVETALAWGWIDSQKRALDESGWLQRFGPRNARSPWSRINREKAEALLKAGRLEPPGLAQVEKARIDGRWERAYHGARTATVPDDLAAALAQSPRAKTFFEDLDGPNRYAILWRIENAKQPETRARRIANFVSMCARGERLHAPRRRRKA